jgi:hypothetical protein
MCSQRLGNLNPDNMYPTGKSLRTSPRLLRIATELAPAWDKATDPTGAFMTWRLLCNGPNHQLGTRRKLNMSGELTVWDTDAEAWGVFLVVFELPTGQPIAA